MDRSCVLRTRLMGSPNFTPPPCAAMATNLSRGSVCDDCARCAHKHIPILRQQVNTQIHSSGESRYLLPPNQSHVETTQVCTTTDPNAQSSPMPHRQRKPSRLRNLSPWTTLRKCGHNEVEVGLTISGASSLSSEEHKLGIHPPSFFCSIRHASAIPATPRLPFRFCTVSVTHASQQDANKSCRILIL